jgi:hypothetical protein
MTDLRLVRAQRILGHNGLASNLSVAGFADDILAVQAPVTQMEALHALAPELKQLGFRYIALELDTEDV